MCTGFFCMDDHFFNHLGPFFQTTTRINSIQKKEDTTEKPGYLQQPVLPKAVNNPVTWSPPVVDLLDENNAIYEEDYSYYFENEGNTVFDDYEWQPYQPDSNQVVNHDVDVLTAPFNTTTNSPIRDENVKNVETKNEKLPFLENYYEEQEEHLIAKNENFEYDQDETSSTCPKAHCRCVCDDVPLF